MQSVKYCQQCGRVIAREAECDFYAYIRLKWCKSCAADVHRRQNAEYMRRLRAQRREAHKLTEEQNALLKQENDLLRQSIRRLIAENSKLKR